MTWLHLLAALWVLLILAGFAALVIALYHWPRDDRDSRRE